MTVSRAAVLPESTHAPLRAFFDYWNALPKTGFLPKLGDFFDHVPPEMAPYVAIVDVRALGETRIRLFGTQLVERVGFDPTGLNVDDLYAEYLRPQVNAMLWEAVSRPAGYLAWRRIVTPGGIVNEHPSIGLPIDVPTSRLRAVLTYSRAITEARSVAFEKALLIQEMKVETWVDLGAGALN